MTRTLIAAAALSALAAAPVALGAMPASGPDAMHMAAHVSNAAPASARATDIVAVHRALVRVTIHNFAFSPARVVVSRGTRIVWVNRDSDPHTVKTAAAARAGGFASEAMDTGDSYAHVMGKTGSFPYICTIHPFMHGTIVVRP
jgi:plastocyanin